MIYSKLCYQQLKGISVPAYFSPIWTCPPQEGVPFIPRGIIKFVLRGTYMYIAHVYTVTVFRHLTIAAVEMVHSLQTRESFVFN